MTLTKKYLIIAGLVLAGLVALAVIFYRKGKNTVTLQQLPGELPGAPDRGNVSGASNDELKRLANNLYADLKGVNAFGHNYDPYQDALKLSDSDLVLLYNAFNSMYQEESRQTLTQWIESDYYSLFITPTIEALLGKLKKLGCR